MRGQKAHIVVSFLYLPSGQSNDGILDNVQDYRREVGGEHTARTASL